MMSAPFVRSAYNYDLKAASDEAAISVFDASLAQQNFRDECDINVIVERFGITGELPSNVRAPTYGDFTGVSDFRSALDAVMAAEDAFMQMPANIRSRFGNDPAEFVDFCSNPSNLDEMRRLGLAVQQAAQASPGSQASGGDARVDKSPAGE